MSWGHWTIGMGWNRLALQVLEGTIERFLLLAASLSPNPTQELRHLGGEASDGGRSLKD